MRPGFRQLGHPATDVVTVWVELAALRDRVEDTEVRSGVGPGTCDPLPVADVLGDVTIEEKTPEVALAEPPVDEEILDQERGGDHPDPVVHPAFAGQLPHPGVDDGVTGLAFPPRFETVGIIPPLAPCRTPNASNDPECAETRASTWA